MNRAAYCMTALLFAALPAAALAQSSGNSSEIALDPAMAGIAAVNRAAELLKSQGTDAAIAYFADALNQARNTAVQRAIRFQLADLYSQDGRPDKALEILKEQIADIPPVAPPQQVQLVPAEVTTPPAAPAQ